MTTTRIDSKAVSYLIDLVNHLCPKASFIKRQFSLSPRLFQPADQPHDLHKLIAWTNKRHDNPALKFSEMLWHIYQQFEKDLRYTELLTNIMNDVKTQLANDDPPPLIVLTIISQRHDLMMELDPTSRTQLQMLLLISEKLKNFPKPEEYHLDLSSKVGSR